MKTKLSSSSHPRLRISALLSGAILVAACASTPPVPTAALQGAQQAIAEAERADVGHYAGAELAEARTKLASANEAVTRKQMPQAERLAQQSRVEAELATARTAALKATVVNEDMRHSNKTLIDEMQRNAGDKK